MNVWFKTWSGKIDPQTGSKLFTKETKPMFNHCLKKASSIIDGLERDELYAAILPKEQSKTGLTTYIGNRGVESKLEKRHHLLAHYANLFMKARFSDSLNIAGVAQGNYRIRYRLRIAKLDKE